MRGASSIRFLGNLYLLHQVNKATKRPQRPSTFLGFDKLVSAGVCQDFDLAVERFDDWELRREQEQVEVAAPTAKKRQTIGVPKYNTIAQLLGYEAVDDSAESRVEADMSADEADILAKLDSGEIDPDELIRTLRGEL